MPCRRLPWIALALLCLSGCASTPTVTANVDPSIDFRAYRTFGFFEKSGTDASGYESLVTQTLKAAARREMEARGYAYAAATPELEVNFNAKLAHHTRVTQTAPVYGYGYYGYRAGFYGGWPGYNTYVDKYTEGTLNIDVVDAARHQLVWEGVAIGRVTEKHRQNREAAINAAVHEIFARFPVPPAAPSAPATP